MTPLLLRREAKKVRQATVRRVWRLTSILPATVGMERDSEGEEEAWLDAMEMGQLDERGYLPRKNVTALTARQVSAVAWSLAVM